ncbi:voltage-dependent calcium channel subunit alpha-2/delta-2-like [Tubulanus polymorphus]|uniref:voltage-dependent calcium channel subunit alpha-2/delta-2-like n=1 Tax=Tubulanus polymorphus TaxID=672921 RepID=UPI003DA34827
MASSIRTVRTECLIFTGLISIVLTVLCVHSASSLQTISDNFADKFDRDLAKWLGRYIRPHIASAEYQKRANAGEINFIDLNIKRLVRTMESSLQKNLAKKMKALKRNVKEAEKLAANFNWTEKIDKSNVTYVHAKNISGSETNFVYNTQFKQKVDAALSSVHIPVEIYEGDYDILQGLKWSARLDEIFAENRRRDPEIMWQNFGSQAGFMRTLPASKWLGKAVDLYDVRRRPWYTQGSSSPKDMFILIDNSGSVHGQALQLMKVAVKSLIDTLGENDFVSVAKFSEKASYISCLTTFVQANYHNKQLLYAEIDKMKASKMASYEKAFEFAFTEFENFENERRNGQGARCNQVIMMLTDSGTEMPQAVFKKWNWDEKKVRVFSYAVGPTTNPVSAIRWMACSNRGYFSQIPSMSAIRTKVQQYLTVLGRPMVLKRAKDIGWTNVYVDASGLGMMTTVTLPVYNTTILRSCVGKCTVPDKLDEYVVDKACRAICSSNQTILGVMGIDIRTKDMERYIPWRKLGPNGYSFAVTNNGYIVFHPHLKAESAGIEDPPNVDLLDIEFDNEAEVKSNIRKKMIDQKGGTTDFLGYRLTLDEIYAIKMNLTYSYTKITNTSFSLALVVPKSRKKFMNVRKNSMRDTSSKRAIFSELDTDKSFLMIAPWDYCPGMAALLMNKANESASILKDILQNKYRTRCKGQESEMLNNLLLDIRITRLLQTSWKDDQSKQKGAGIISRFIATNGGLTRVFPQSEGIDFEQYADPWKASYFQRAFSYADENPDGFLFAIQPLPESFNKTAEPNYTNPNVMVAKAVKLSNYSSAKVAVIGAFVTVKKLSNKMVRSVTECKDETSAVCYLLDRSGFLLASNQPDLEIGRFIGHKNLDPQLAYWMYNYSQLSRIEFFDYQATCPKPVEKTSAGPRSFYIPTISDLLDSMKWWSVKSAWTYIVYNIFSSFTDLFTNVYAAKAPPPPEEIPKNISCIKRSAYYFPTRMAKVVSGTLQCNNCTRNYYMKTLEKSNLMIVVADPLCNFDDEESCQTPYLPQESAPVDGPDLCTRVPRYRRRIGKCHDRHPREYTLDCGVNGSVKPLMILIISMLLMSSITLKT